MDKQIELSKEQIEEIVDSSNMNLNKEQKEKIISDMQNGKKSPSTLIQNGDIESLQALIDDGLDVNEKFFSGAPLIALAIMYSDIDIVKLLIENGADVNIIVQNRPLLVYALMFGDIDIIKLLIESGADVNVIANNQPLVLLAMEFGNNEVVKLLIKNGANIEFENSDTNLLEKALLFSNTEIAELCIEKGSKFSQHILFDVAKRKDGYIFDRKEIQNILDEKKEFRISLSGLEENINELIQTKESIISNLEKTKNKMYEMKINTNTQDQNIIIDDFNIHVDKSIEKQNNETSKHSQELNKLHKRLHKVRSNMTNMINKINDIQDKMTVLTIIDFIKVFIKYGGDVNYKGEDGSTVLRLLAFHGYEDCVKLLIEKGADIDIKNSGIETPLLLAYENNHFNVVKLLIDSGADVNITMGNGESFYKKAKHDKNHEVLAWIENSPKYIKITHDPKELVEILKKFSSDEKLRYTNHPWTDTTYKNFYVDMEDGWNEIKSDLKSLSPELCETIDDFLLGTNDSKNVIGFSTEDIKNKLILGNTKPDLISELENSIKLFKRSILIKNDESLTLLDLFARVLEKSQLDLDIDLENIEDFKSRFYTDVHKLEDAIELILKDIYKMRTKAIIKVLADDDDNFITLKIIEVGSTFHDNSQMLIETIGKTGNFSSIHKLLKSICHWDVETQCKDGLKTIHYLYPERDGTTPYVDPKSNELEGFTHILRFYK